MAYEADTLWGAGLLCESKVRPGYGTTGERRQEFPPLHDCPLGNKRCRRSWQILQVGRPERYLLCASDVCPLWVIRGHLQRTSRCQLSANSGHPKMLSPVTVYELFVRSIWARLSSQVIHLNRSSTTPSARHCKPTDCIGASQTEQNGLLCKLCNPSTTAAKRSACS